MLGQAAFYNATTKNLIAAFGTLFNDISIVRTVNNQTQTIKVPIAFASADKAYNRTVQDPDMNYNFKTVKPRIAFLLSSIEYDVDRKIQPHNYTLIGNPNTATAKMQTQPVPYNLNFELSIAITNIEDGLQIIEQILPFFNPEYMIKTKDFPSLSLTRDTPVILQSVNYQDNTPDSDYTDGRELEWTLDFVIKTYYYGPVDTVKTIKQVNLFMFDSIDPTTANQVSRIDTSVVPSTANKTDQHQETVVVTEPGTA